MPTQRIVARFRNQKITIQKPKCAIQKPKRFRNQNDRFSNQNWSVSEPKCTGSETKKRNSETKTYDSETKMYDSETTIYDLETKTWLPPPLTTSDHYVACWTSQEIKTPPPRLTAMLHLEFHKRSKPGHLLWPLCRILNFTRDLNPATPSDHYVASWTSQEI